MTLFNYMDVLGMINKTFLFLEAKSIRNEKGAGYFRQELFVGCHTLFIYRGWRFAIAGY